jgi:translation initiation factor IF-2
VKAVIETKSRLKSQQKEAVASEEKSPKAETLQRKDYYSVSKLSGTKLTGQTIDLSQFNKPKRKRRA